MIIVLSGGRASGRKPPRGRRPDPRAAMLAALPPIVPGGRVTAGPHVWTAQTVVRALRGCHAAGTDRLDSWHVRDMLRDASDFTGRPYAPGDRAAWLRAAADVESLLPGPVL